MAYTHTTWAQLDAALAARLHDPTGVYWLQAERRIYLTEALRVFSALSAFWRERGTFDTVANVAFYDLPTQIPALLGYTVTDIDVVTEIQYHLLEPAAIPWAGTEQFSIADLQAAVERRRNLFLVDTGMILTQSTVAMPPPPIGRVTLPDNVIDVRRILWKDVNNVVYHLWREDELALNASDYTWAIDPGTPYAYSVLGPPPLQVQIAAVPLDAGTIGMISVNTGAALDVTTGVILGIPDDWCWVVKWGALADLLGKDGPAADPERAAWCEKRYQAGVKLAQEVACIVQAQLQGVNLFPDSLNNTDAAYYNWQNDAAAAPSDIAIAGYNLVGVRPIPDGIYSLTFDVIRRAPIPAVGGTQVQIGREQLDGILDYAEHLAMFKVGGPEFSATERQATNFMLQASTYNRRMAAAARYIFEVADYSRKESKQRPRTLQGSALGTLPAEQ